MGKNSKIEWCDHTFSIAIGCTKVSPGCKHCYAEVHDGRWNKGCHWGPKAPRKQMSDSYWRSPEIWNAKAAAKGVTEKVFASSLCDVFEDHPDMILPRAKLFQLISRTPNLIWQLLTKRPENIKNFVPVHWYMEGFPKNVWIGTSVENQEEANKRIPELLDIPAKIRFLSCERLLGKVSICLSVRSWQFNKFGSFHSTYFSDKIQWVICGGESENEARPMHPDWADHLRSECRTASVPFFFKQWGEYLPYSQSAEHSVRSSQERLFPAPPNSIEPYDIYYKLGKHAAGAKLDGKEYKNFPVI